MGSLLDSLKNITPTLNALDTSKTPPVLYLDTLETNVIVTIEPWDNIRTDQTAFLLLNGIQIAVKQIEPLDPTGATPRAGKAPVFTVPVATNFFAGDQDKIEIKLTDTANNIGMSQPLNFDVKASELADEVKIDLTEGAGGYNSDNPYLMPANIAVLRGPPGMHLTAHGKGAVRFQDVGGSDKCNFYFDENGLSPLVLIKIDNIHVDSANAAASQDEIIISHNKENDTIVSKPVVFGDYETPSDPAVAKVIKSVSCNTVGIADGTTLCIISIIFDKSYIDQKNDDTVYIMVPQDLSVDTKTYNKNFPVGFSKPNLPFVKILDYTAEFGVTSQSTGLFTVSFFPSRSAGSYYSKSINFKALS